MGQNPSDAAYYIEYQNENVGFFGNVYLGHKYLHMKQLTYAKTPEWKTKTLLIQQKFYSNGRD